MMAVKLPTTLRKTNGKRLYVTTVFATNIHCTNCVSHIEGVVRRSSFGHYVDSIDISVISGEIIIHHEPGLPIKDVCREISDAAFEVEGASTVNCQERLISEIRFQHGGERLFQDAADKLLRSSVPLPVPIHSMPSRTKRKRHFEICLACQRKEERDFDEPVGSDDVQHNWQFDEKKIQSVIVASQVPNMPSRFEDENSIEGMGKQHMEAAEMPYVHDATGSVNERSIEALRWRCELSISGMTCSACTNAVHDGLDQLEFVETVQVNLMTNSAIVNFNGSRIKGDDLVETVEDMGFEASMYKIEQVHPESGDRKPSSVSTLVSASEIVNGAEGDSDWKGCERQVQILIEGLFCESCPRRVTDDLQRRYAGHITVEKAPTLQHPVLTVSYLPGLQIGLTVRNVLQAVAEVDVAHFRTSIYHPPSIEERSRRAQTQERKRLLLRLVLGTIVAIPTFIIGVVLMDLLPPDHTLRRYIMEPVWSGLVPRGQWALFFLATPVYLFAADIFHKRAVKEIRALWHSRSRTPILRRFVRFGSMNLLVSAGTTVAYVSSLGLLISDATTADAGSVSKSSSTYFDTVVFLTFFILIGRFLEAYSKSRAGDAISLLGDRKPQDAILTDQTGSHTSIRADTLEIGDHILVAHGQSPAGDGVLVDETALFDESSLTGESRSVEKRRGDDIFTGTINVGKPIVVEIRKFGGASMLDQIIAVVREGQTRRAPIEKIADLITGYFVPVITALAIMTFAIWITLGYSGNLDPRYLDGQGGGWAFWSLEFAIAVFVVACPCGIGLAAPTAMFVGGGLAAKHGILARGGGQAFQDASDLDAIVFDKTGTLTEGGDLRVTDKEILVNHWPERWTRLLLWELEKVSAHPIASAITKSLDRVEDVREEAHMFVVRSKEIDEIPGRGMQGLFQTDLGTWRAKIGCPDFIAGLMPEQRFPARISQCIDFWQSESKTVVTAAIQGPNINTWSLAAVLAVEDVVRPSAQPAVKALQRRGLEVYMLTGDNWSTARSVASRVGIKSENVFAGVLPTQKAEKIEWLQRNLRRRARASSETSETTHDLERQQVRLGRRSFLKAARQILVDQGILNFSEILDIAGQDETEGDRARVAFVGDGINDAPALSRADISISPSSGAPIATNSSSFILMATSLMAIPELFDISTKVFRRVKLNFAWALIYNIVLIPVAAGVFFKVREDGFRLGPVWGSLAMALSSVSVVVSSLLLRWERPWPWQWFRVEQK